MARKISCPVCDSERFRAVVVSLPSGAVRVTDFDYCLSCATVSYRPEERALLPEERRDSSLSNVTNFSMHISPAVFDRIAKTFPDPNTAILEMQRAHYRHPTYGRLVLIYKRGEIRGTGETGMKWHLVEAKRFTE